MALISCKNNSGTFQLKNALLNQEFLTFVASSVSLFGRLSLPILVSLDVCRFQYYSLWTFVASNFSLFGRLSLLILFSLDVCRFQF